MGRGFFSSTRKSFSRAKEIAPRFFWFRLVYSLYSSRKRSLARQCFLAYAKEKLVLYRADFPKRKKNQLAPALKAKNESLAAQYNPQGYFPWVVVFDKDKAVKGTFVYTKDPVIQYIEQIKSF